jgi:hypothetical protein
LRSHKTTLILLLAPSSTLKTLKEEIAVALNDTSDEPRKVKADDISIYRQIEGQWQRLEEEEGKGAKRAREATLEDLDIRGVGSGSTVDSDGETLAYTVKNGLNGAEKVNIEAYPRDD